MDVHVGVHTDVGIRVLPCECEHMHVRDEGRGGAAVSSSPVSG